MKSTLQKGTLVTWKDDRGFGFIKPDDSNQQIFVHITAFKDSTYRPRDGDVIYYYLTSDKNGRSCAVNASIAKELRQHRSFSQHRSSKDSSSKSSSSQDISAKSRRTNTSKASLILNVSILSFVPLIGLIKLAQVNSALLPAFLYVAMSLLAYLLYAGDKSCAKQGKRRIPEKTLHLVEMVGGWPGAFIAQQHLNHKSTKKSYQIQFWLIVAAHLLLWIVVLCFS